MARSRPNDGTPTPGDILGGKYRVEQVLGQGGMGTVVEATHLQLQQRIALKFMLPALAGNPDFLERFFREARAAARLRGEHVARVLDVGTFPPDDEDETYLGGAPYIVMELLEGCDLREMIHAGPLPVAEAVTYLLQACEAVAEAHAAGIVHRDLKPHNLFVARTPQGRRTIKVLDFGVAKLLGDDASPDDALTHTASVIGSPRYMAPEQLLSARTVGPQADVWALGVCLYQCLTGQTPFDTQDGVMALGALVLHTSPTPVTSHRADVPRAVVEIIARCLEKDPQKRFADAADLGTALAGVATTYASAAEPAPLFLPPTGAAEKLPSGSVKAPSTPGLPGGDTRLTWDQSRRGSIIPANPRSQAMTLIAAGAAVLGIVGGTLMVSSWLHKRAPERTTAAIPVVAVAPQPIPEPSPEGTAPQPTVEAKPPPVTPNETDPSVPGTPGTPGTPVTSGVTTIGPSTPKSAAAKATTAKPAAPGTTPVPARSATRRGHDPMDHL